MPLYGQQLRGNIHARLYQIFHRVPDGSGCRIVAESAPWWPFTRRPNELQAGLCVLKVMPVERPELGPGERLLEDDERGAVVS